jgi:urease subunit beta
MKPGEYLLNEDAGDLLANAGRETARVPVRHTGDRPIQVGSHFHFFEVNRALVFDRAAAYGMRLNIAAGTAIRFEPGEEKEVSLVAYAGRRVVFGHNGLVEGALDESVTRERAMERLGRAGGAGSAAEGEHEP